MAPTLKRLVSLALALAVCAAGAGAADAQQKKGAPAKKPQAGQLFEDWGIECEAQADKSEKCFISQQHNNKEGQRILNFNIGYLGPAGEAMFVVFLPLGIDLAAGAAVRIDPGPQVALQIATCVPEGCRARAVLDAAGLKALRAAKAITVLVVSHDTAQTVALPLSLKGLVPALAGLK